MSLLQLFSPMVLLILINVPLPILVQCQYGCSKKKDFVLTAVPLVCNVTVLNVAVTVLDVAVLGLVN